MARTKTADLLMWVGASHYPTVASFVREAKALGVSKRVAQVPVGVKLERSLLFLAHDEAARVECGVCKGRGTRKGRIGIQLMERDGRAWRQAGVDIKMVGKASTFRRLRDKTYQESDRKMTWRVVPGQDLCDACAGRGERPDGRIFGVCRIDGFELVFDCAAAAAEYKDRRQKMRRRDRIKVTHVVGGVENETRRRCGYRKIGGSYLVSGENAPPSLQELAQRPEHGFSIRGPLVVFSEPVVYPGGRFRGAKVVDGRDVLKRARSAARRSLKGSKRAAGRRSTHTR